MVLYRPFLHHALRDTHQMGRTSLKAYACGSDCVKAAMQAVWLLERLEASAMFSSALWFIKLIVSFTAAILSLFVTCNYGAPTVDETADAVRRIRELCARHSRECDALKRCLEFLEVGLLLLPFPPRVYMRLVAWRTTETDGCDNRVSPAKDRTATSTQKPACGIISRRALRTLRMLFTSRGRSARRTTICCKRLACRISCRLSIAGSEEAREGDSGWFGGVRWASECVNEVWFRDSARFMYTTYILYPA